MRFDVTTDASPGQVLQGADRLHRASSAYLAPDTGPEDL